MSLKDHVVEALTTHQDGSGEKLPQILSTLAFDHGLADKWTDIVGDGADVQKAVDLSMKFYSAIDKLDPEMVHRAIEDMRNDSEIQNMGTPEEIDQALQGLETLFSGNLEATKMFATVLMIAFSPKKGIAKLVERDTKGILSLLQSIYTNGEVIANIDPAKRVEQAIEKHENQAMAEGIEFGEHNYNDPAYLRALSTVAWIYNHSLGILHHKSAETGLWTMEILEKALRVLNILKNDETFTTANNALVELVTKNGLTPLQKQLLVRFGKEILAEGIKKVLEQKEGLLTGDAQVDQLVHQEHNAEIQAAGLDNSDTDMAA